MGLTKECTLASDNHPPDEIVRADEIRRGDLLVHDGRVLTVTELTAVYYWENGERHHGIEIATRDGSARWCLYREHGAVLHRVRAS